MARSPLTLAALATSAVPELDVVGASVIGSGTDGDYESAILTGRDGRHWIIRVPTSELAESEQSGDLVALRALSAGVRSRLPFEVSSFAGQVPVGGTRAVVYEFVYGSKQPVDVYDGELAVSAGRAIAAIHALPTSFIADAGLPVLSPTEILRGLVTVMDRAAATNLVPATLLGRWERCTENSVLWQFAPTVINGGITADSFLSVGDEITGLLGWHNLSVGDPARDLYWALASAGSDTVFDSYSLVRGASDRQVHERALIYSELEVAKWLLHGTKQRDTEIVDDAVEMLTNLADSVAIDMNRNLGDTAAMNAAAVSAAALSSAALSSAALRARSSAVD
ncbi:MAG: macrolide 2-phosphotransferase [Microbacteriaceae bacterium]|nr:macrolide 2-phosphotransferase [Microbacteriaceae bacterium]